MNPPLTSSGRWRPWTTSGFPDRCLLMAHANEFGRGLWMWSTSQSSSGRLNTTLHPSLSSSFATMGAFVPMPPGFLYGMMPL